MQTSCEREETEVLEYYEFEDCKHIDYEPLEDDTTIDEMYELYSLEKKAELDKIVKSLSSLEIEKLIIDLISHWTIIDMYTFLLNNIPEDKLKSLYMLFEKQYNVEKYFQRINPTKDMLIEERKIFTIKELAKKYHCSESTIKRRLGTKK